MIMAVSAVFFIVSTVLSLESSKKQGKAASARAAGQRELRSAQDNQSRIQQRISEEKSRRSRAKTVREARIRRGQIEAQAQAGGVLDSSGFIGATGSIRSQVAGSLGSSRFIESASRQATQRNISASQSAQSLYDRATSLDTSAAFSQQASQLFGQGASFSLKTKGFSQF